MTVRELIHRSIGAAARLALVSLALGAPRTAVAQCSYTPLSSGVPVATGTAGQDFQFAQANPYWTAVGLRASSAIADWDLYMYSSVAAYPTCVAGGLAGSTRSAGVADVIVGDFNSNPPGTYYARAVHFSADVSTAVVQWDDGPDILPVNGPIQPVTMLASDVVKCWDVYLAQGTSYHFTYNALGSSRLLLFRNPANAPYWNGRDGAVAEIAPSPSGFDFTAPAGDWYGLVLVNDGGTDLTFLFLGVSTCSPPTALTSSVVVHNPDANSYYQFTPNSALWTAIATRPDLDAVGQQNMAVYGSGSGSVAPTCFADFRASSNYGGGSSNVVAGQSDPNEPGTWYATSSYTTGASYPVGARTEWDGDGRVLLVNDPSPVQGSMGPTDLIDCYNVYLEAGKDYRLNLDVTANFYLTANLWENPGIGSYWAGAASGMSFPNWTISPAHTGWHALVLSHERLDSGTYTVSITRCETPTTLADHVSVRTPEPTGFYGFTQALVYWTAVGVHSNSAQSDWDLVVNGSPSGSPAPVCFSSPLANSLDAGQTDFVVGDFNPGGNAFGPCYVRPYRFSGGSDAFTEWDSGPEQIVVGDPLTHVVLSDSDFVRCWDVLLNPGVTYTLEFNRDLSIDAKAFLFRSNNAPYWVGRSGAYLQAATTTTFTVPVQDYYGLVVVNDRGSGAVDFRIQPPNVGVTPQGPRITALRDAGPNPSRGPLSLSFDLAEAGEVRFDLLDVRGRVVASRPAERLDAGSWNRSWDPFGSSGRSAGVYFLRMHAAGREIGKRKIARIE